MSNLNTKVATGSIGLGTIAAAAITKPILEAALRPIVGDANILSAGVKGVIAVAGHQALPGFVGNVVGISAGMDAIEDGLAVVGLGSKNWMTAPKTAEVNF